MSQDIIKSIFEKVNALTFDGKLKWRPSPDTNSFVTEIGGYKILIFSSLSNTFIVRRISDNVELGRFTSSFLNPKDIDEKLDRLFEKIKRDYLQIDEGLNDLINKLEDL